MNGADTFDVEKTLQLIGKVLDVSLDIGRNRMDTDFVAEGGELFYVFDENLFETFVQLSGNAHTVNSFHSANLCPERDAYDVSLENQVALITFEYLFSSNLPGAKRNTLYMTRGHRDELRHRIRLIATNLEERVDVAAKELEEKIELGHKIQQLISGVRSKDEAIRFAGREDAQLAKDIEVLANEGAEPDALKRFELARFGASSLAGSEVSEPLDQLQRILTPPLRNRIRTLHLDFTPTARELAVIEEDASRWFERLSDERERDRKRRAQDGSRRSEFRARSDSRLRTDAQAIALVRWAASKAYSNQRVILVTGDRILFNTYRRWYSELKSSCSAYYENFILRRVSQYLPILNMRDSENDISRNIDRYVDTISIFTRLQSIVEIVLLPFNLSQYKQPQANIKEMEASRRRHHLALTLYYLTSIKDAAPLAPFVSSIQGDWYEQMRDYINDVLVDLRRLERFSIGSFLHYIASRLNEEHKSLARQIEKVGEAQAGEILKRHLTNILQQIREKSTEAWLPALAEEFVRELRPPVPKRRRVPLTIWFPIGEGRNIADLIERWLSEPDAVDWRNIFEGDGQLSQAPFVIASTLALFSEVWSDADRFAEIALKDYLSVMSETEKTASNQSCELRFLLALTKRFRLADIDTHVQSARGIEPGIVGMRSVTLMLQLFERAKLILDDLVEYHLGESEGGGRSDGWHKVCVLRAYSERGALCLFVAAGLAPDQGYEQDEWRRERAIEFIGQAKADLTRCLGLGEELDGIEEWSKFIARVKKQYVPIMVATEVLRSLIVPVEGFSLDPECRKLGRAAREYLDVNKDSTFALVRAELLAFFILEGNDAEARNELKRLVSEEDAQTLALDRWMLRAIGRRFI
jgi:hypothetical protein